MVDNRIHHSGGVNAYIGRIIPPGSIAAWNLGLCITCPKHITDNA